MNTNQILVCQVYAIICLTSIGRLLGADVKGTVVDVTPDVSSQKLDALEKAASLNSDQEFEEILQGMYRIKGSSLNGDPVGANVEVTAKSNFDTKKTVTDSKGAFSF
ncbi:MAG: hypothetical protein B9S32_11890 [Verrucomicrobia bacterium Tous-C9LFEB]|nr:MAG: hypothetical protein B9S32_11890 [Verrucomicrobia bacterium Tous-C9LFEB]